MATRKLTLKEAIEDLAAYEKSAQKLRNSGSVVLAARQERAAEVLRYYITEQKES